jgi:hypothetical protein
MYTRKYQDQSSARKNGITTAPHLSPAQSEGATIHEATTIDGHAHPASKLPVPAARRPRYAKTIGFPRNTIQDPTLVHKLSTW